MDGGINYDIVHRIDGDYMIQQKHRGVTFRSDGNINPVAYVDASNKPDPNDSKCQYGHVHLWMGGPGLPQITTVVGRDPGDCHR